MPERPSRYEEIMFPQSTHNGELTPRDIHQRQCEDVINSGYFSDPSVGGGREADKPEIERARGKREEIAGEILGEQISDIYR